MHYRECLSKLYSLAEKRIPKHGLDNMKRLLFYLDHPEKRNAYVHIAGSNGKGTAAMQMAESLQYGGRQVGLFTSPHISSFRERICINGRMISEEDAASGLNRIFSLIQAHNLDVSYFEVATALAFHYFSRQGVDIAVLETGLGGRYDATNVALPLVSVITSISLEHTDVLGDTIDKIAYEKAGIIKPNTPVVIGPTVPLDVVEPIAKGLRAPVIQCHGHIAKRALDTLGLRYDPKGLSARLPCRFEQIGRFILDTAHNPEACRFLIKNIKARFPGKKIRCVFGFSKNKTLEDVLNALGPYITEFIMFDCRHPRLLPAKLLHETALNLGYKSSILKTVDIDGELILVCGSFYILSEIRKQLGLCDVRDFE